MIGERMVDGFPALTLSVARPAASRPPSSRAPGWSAARCAIAARSCWASARGLRRYVAERRPWASRCCTRGRTGSAAAVRAGRPRGRPRLGAPPLRARRQRAADARAARRRAGWRVERHEPPATAGCSPRVSTSAPTTADRRVPVPARARARGRAARAALTITTTVRADRRRAGADRLRLPPLPALPGVAARATGSSRSPVRERLRLDERMLPTGEREPVASSRRRSGRGRSTTPTSRRRTARRSCSPAAAGGSSCVRRRLPLRAGLRAGRGRRGGVRADDGADQRAGRGGRAGLLEPGDSYRAAFSITVADSAGWSPAAARSGGRARGRRDTRDVGGVGAERRRGHVRPAIARAAECGRAAGTWSASRSSGLRRTPRSPTAPRRSGAARRAHAEHRAVAPAQDQPELVILAVGDVRQVHHTRRSCRARASRRSRAGPAGAVAQPPLGRVRERHRRRAGGAGGELRIGHGARSAITRRLRFGAGPERRRSRSGSPPRGQHEHRVSPAAVPSPAFSCVRDADVVPRRPPAVGGGPHHAEVKALGGGDEPPRILEEHVRLDRERPPRSGQGARSASWAAGRRAP